jgi:TatD DNase family protein
MYNQIFDTHCHLQSLTNDFLISSLKGCVSENITNILNVSLSGDDSPSFFKDNIEVFNKFPQIKIFHSIGNHPSTANKCYEFAKIIEDYKKHQNIIAIGETGFDFFHGNNPSEEEQINNFIQHKQASLLYNIPMIIHSRNAEQITYNNLKINTPKFILHCFTGSLEFAKQVLDMNGMISFSGIITYKNARLLREIVKYVPISRILCETDAPYLVPLSFQKKNKINSPSFIVETVRKISEIKEISFEETSNIIFNNTLKFFQI